MSKYAKLFLSLFFDGIGMLSYLIPWIGEISDLVWAPLSGLLMSKLYKGNIGKAATLFVIIEEALPGLDIIPTFTLMWIYTYLYKKPAKEVIIDVETK